jgi:FkbM family methyltransferase
MNFLFKIIDFFYQRKKYSFLKKKILRDINIFIDVGAHHGDTIIEFLEIFSINKIYAFEPSKKNFDKLRKKVIKIQKNNSVKIKIFPLGLGRKNDFLPLNEITDGVSNTFNSLNTKSKYFKKKKFFTTLFGMKKFINNTVVTKIVPLKKIIEEEKIDKIDFIKIDTEGFEYNTLLGLEKEIKKIRFILFEHHYDNMIVKNYKFRDIHKLLKDNEFQMIFKTKMPFRKSFDYVYENKRLS